MLVTGVKFALQRPWFYSLLLLCILAFPVVAGSNYHVDRTGANRR